MKSFNFHMTVAKAEQDDKGFYLRGVSSTTDLDSQADIMAPSALNDMVKYVGQIPLTDSHTNEIGNEIGTLVDAHIEDGKFVTVFKVDEDDAHAMRLYNKVAKGANCGFSVGGKILSTAPSLEKGVKRIIEHVELNHIMLTKRPSNPSTFAHAFSKALDEIIQEDTHMPIITENIIAKDASTLMTEALELLKTEAEANLVKAGAKFSAETMKALGDIHSRLGEMLGMNTVVIGEMNEDGKTVEVVPGGGKAELDHSADGAANSGNVTAHKSVSEEDMKALIKTAILENIVPLLKSDRSSLVTNEEVIAKSASDEFKETKSITELRAAFAKRLSE